MFPQNPVGAPLEGAAPSQTWDEARGFGGNGRSHMARGDQGLLWVARGLASPLRKTYGCVKMGFNGE